MSNIAVINAQDITPYAFKPLKNGLSAFDMVLAFSKKLPDVKKIYIFYSSADVEKLGKDSQFTLVKTSFNDMLSLLRSLDEISGDQDDIFYFYGDCPLLDLDITLRMYENHRNYFAQYTFADGYPYGLTPEILKKEILVPLKSLGERKNASIGRNGIFTVLQADINAFDIETEISPKDLRLLRVSLTGDTKRNYTQTKSIIENGGENAESVMAVIEEKGDLLRTYPAYFSIQITGGCRQACSYCPYPLLEKDILSSNEQMKLADFEAIIDQLSALSVDGVVNLSPWGEPALHTEIVSIIEACLRKPGISLVIETSGVGWEEGTLQEVKDLYDKYMPSSGTIEWIVSLDAMDKSLYKTLRGDGYNEALLTCEKLSALFPDTTYVQAVRMKKNEDDLESFFRYWNEKLGNVIIQKYDYFSGYLKQEKVTDLSPLIRFPCWHLKRDMTILLDGTVPLCREDLRRQHVLGNIFAEPLSLLWEKGKKYFKDHSRGEYTDICKGCDEYYTYNF